MRGTGDLKDSVGSKVPESASRRCTPGPLAGLLPALLLVPGAAYAQELLPEIVVTAPSPILPPWEQRGNGDGLLAGGNLRPVAGRTFAPVTIVPRASIASNPGATVGDVVARTPGVTSSSFAPGAGRPIIRGLDNNRVRIQENGVGVGDVSEIGEDHGVPIDPLVAERIEVIRGPATLRWGSQAIGGVVNVDNNRIPLPGTRQGLRAIIRGAFTTVDQGRQGAILVDGRHGRFAVHADVFRRVAEDYRTPDGRQANSRLHMGGAAFGASYIFDSGYIGASLSHFGSLYHVPGGEAAENGVRIDLAQTKFTAKGEVRIKSAFIDTLRFWFGAVDYKHDEKAFDGGVLGVKGTFKNRQYEGRVEAQLTPFQTGLGTLKTAVGIQLGKRNIGTSGEAGGLLAPARANRIAAYIFNELHFAEKWRLQGALRVESVRINGRAAIFPANLLPNGMDVPEVSRSRQFVPVSLSFGILRDLPFGMTASATVQMVQRAPSALELFSKGPHEATGTFEIGNPDMKIERAFAFEAGLRKSRGRFRFDATAFHARYKGYIYKRLTGVLCGEEFDDCGVETELKQVVFAQKDARFTGAEFHGQFDVVPLMAGMFGIDGQFDVVRARFADGTNVPRIPPVRIGGGVYWYGKGWFARIGLLHAFAQSRINPAEETRTGSYNLLKAEVSYRHKWKVAGIERQLTVGVAGSNLLNARVRNHVSFKKDEVLQPGRNLRFFANLRF